MVSVGGGCYDIPAFFHDTGFEVFIARTSDSVPHLDKNTCRRYSWRSVANNANAASHRQMTTAAPNLNIAKEQGGQSRECHSSLPPLSISAG